MKSVCRGIQVGGEGSVRANGYKPRGLRNKRKRTWANQRKDKDLLAKIRERQSANQDFEDGFEDND